MEKPSRKEREKLRREQEIIDAAEKMFLELGYDGTAMDAIAEKAEFTKRTVYQYFSGKEELYFAVILRSYELMGRYIYEAMEEGSSVLERIENGCRGFYRFHRENPGRVEMISSVGHMKNKVRKSRYLDRFMELDRDQFSFFRNVIIEGREEGSIVPLYDEKIEACTIIFMLTAFFNLFSVTGQSFIRHCGLEEEAFIEAAIRIITEHLKP